MKEGVSEEVDRGKTEDKRKGEEGEGKMGDERGRKENGDTEK